MTEKNIASFRAQIKEDVDLIGSQWSDWDERVKKPEFAFNYWILSRIFSLDEEFIPDCITEYQDKGIDCFVHFPENKELIIIQNKYYSEEASVQRKEVADFLMSPVNALMSGKYKRSADLQAAFDVARNDKDYKVMLYFFATTDSKSSDVDQLVQNFNKKHHDVDCLLTAAYYGISQIYDLYYGKNYWDEMNFTHSLGTLNRGTFASLREVYEIEGYDGYHIFTPVPQIYKMLKAAEDADYSLFDKNIREYLGDNAINNGIVETLKSESERNNFVYYNNGITVICQAVGKDQLERGGELRMIPLVNPQIVNGCQTANSIKNVLENLSDAEREQDYKNVYVMLKALVIKDRQGKESKNFYENVVKYTNKQNAISDKAFTSNIDYFYRLQDEFRARGFLLQVKPSDAHKFKELSPLETKDLIQEAKKTIQNLNYPISKRDDICIPLEKLLQVFLAFVNDGYFAFTKKHLVLRPNHEVFKSYTSRIHDYLNHTNMIKLFCLYKRAENERKKSEDKRTPIPYYVIGFLGELIGERTKENIQSSLNIIFDDKEICDEAYKYLVTLSKVYRNSMKIDYNVMIKRPIDENILRQTIGNTNCLPDWKTINKWAKEQN